jgi:hypothetical protein
VKIKKRRQPLLKLPVDPHETDPYGEAEDEVSCRKKEYEEKRDERKFIDLPYEELGRVV